MALGALTCTWKLVIGVIITGDKKHMHVIIRYNSPPIAVLDIHR